MRVFFDNFILFYDDDVIVRLNGGKMMSDENCSMIVSYVFEIF